MSRDREQELFDRVARLTRVLEFVADRTECWSVEQGREPCGTCVGCVAARVLREKTPSFDWRYRGAAHERVLDGHHERERRMVHALAEQVDDSRLAGILGHDRRPTAQEWYVAASVVQWLATNVGSQVLRQAGWRYEDEVRAVRGGVR